MSSQAEFWTINGVKRHMLPSNVSDYSASSSYSVGQWVWHDDANPSLTGLYVCNTAIGSGGEAWNSAHWTAMDGVSSLFSSANTSYDAANMNYTATGEQATTVKAKIQSIETTVGTANANLEDALGGNS